MYIGLLVLKVNKAQVTMLKYYASVVVLFNEFAKQFSNP